MMGALDFLKEFQNRAIDAATYKLLERNFQMQEENNRLLKEKADLLHEENLRLKEEVQSLRGDVAALRERASQATKAAEFVTKDGIAYRRKNDGSFEETGYCPNCHAVMGSLEPKIYSCANCKHVQRVETLPALVASSLASEVRGNT